jgi:hypothetical protein
MKKVYLIIIQILKLINLGAHTCGYAANAASITFKRITGNIAI